MVSTITLHRRQLLKINTAAVIVLYCLATTHISLVLARAIQGFINHDEGNTVLYFADIARPINRSKDMVYITMIVLADSVVLWRCYIVWNKNLFVIALPTIMIIGTAISGYTAVGHWFQKDPLAGAQAAIHWAVAMLAMSMTTNIILTILTAGRIWYMSRKVGNLSGNTPYNKIILLIVESGLVMGVSKIIEFVLFQIAPGDGLSGLNALYIVMDSMPQIMGICPTFIIMVVNSGFTSMSLTSDGGRHGVAVPMVLVAAKPDGSMFTSTHSTLGTQQSEKV